ncbi:hypothetical protein ACH47Z_45245 [Streptomyces sp. NPDC020192]|uniref:hypothetical protein n=1 Tax=Streptomyces sp. NPDC020192 TaxID=3365066 RepID=UPI0037A56AA8
MPKKTFLPTLVAAIALLATTGASAAAALPQLSHPLSRAGSAVTTVMEHAAARSADARDADDAIRWFESRQGSTAFEGLCERAVRLAWDRNTHHDTALGHWNSDDGERHVGDTNPPKGAFVFWRTSDPHGHVGIADGAGGYWATNVHRAIGHFTSLGFFSNYLGWKPGNSD